MVRMKHRNYEVDDEDAFDERGVCRDGRGVRVPIYLTDSAMPRRAPILHRPGQVRLSDGEVDLRERALAARSARLKDAWKPGSPIASDDDVFDLATKIAPMLGLAPPKRNVTRSPMDADPDPGGDPGAEIDPRQAAIDARSRWKKDAWKTRAKR
jgi:hypothetical protein